MARFRIGRLRTRLTATVLVAVALALAALALIFNAVLANRLSDDAGNVLRSRAAAELASLTTVDGVLRVREAPDDAALDTEVWVFSGRAALERPATAPPVVARAARTLNGGPRTWREVPGVDTRLLSVPVVRHGTRLGTVVAGVSLAPYDRTRRIALVASLLLCAGVLAVVALMTRWAVVRALRPVSRMTSQAAEWSEGELGRRFGLGPPRDELTQLAATLDDLLDRLAQGMRREQRFTAEVSHELRTPLTKIRAEAEIALRRKRTPAAYRDALSTVLRTAERMTAVVDTLLAAARAEADGGRAACDAVRAAAAAAETCRDLSESRGVELAVTSSLASARVAADQEVVERILFPLIENGCRYASTEVSVEVAAADGRVVVSVGDDGPGVDRDELRTIFEPGERGRAASSGPTGAGLGLALARRLARQVGGDVEAAHTGGGGSFRVELPRGDA